MYKPPKRKKLTQKQRRIVYEKCNGHCAYCGCEIKINQMQVDHVIPMEFYNSYQSIGIDLDTIENMLPACRSCNNYKSTLTIDKFRAAIEHFPDVLKKNNTTYRNAIRFGIVTPIEKKIVFYFEKCATKEEKQ